MPKDRYLTARESADLLGISLPTLYAYVSRGLIRSEAAAEGKRERRYYSEDIEKLIARKEGRRNPEKLAQDALHWGAPVLDSAITLITDDALFYNGFDASRLAHDASVEEVAALIWLGDQTQADRLFGAQAPVSAQKYEAILLQIELNGGVLTGLQELQTFLPIAASDDMSAYDLRPESVAMTGAHIMRLMISVAAGDVPETITISQMLQRGWAPDFPEAEKLFRAALILCADHELNASSFTARVVAAAGSTPYDVVISGLSALQGVKHGGITARVEAFTNEVGIASNARDVIVKRLRRGERIPGFGHMLYHNGDPRARTLLDLMTEILPESEQWQRFQAIRASVRELINDEPTIDFALVALSQCLGLPDGHALLLFALGRTIGWIGHSIEQYREDRMIRPRARYTGNQPGNDDTKS